MRDFPASFSPLDHRLSYATQLASLRSTLPPSLTAQSLQDALMATDSRALSGIPDSLAEIARSRKLLGLDDAATQWLAATQASRSWAERLEVELSAASLFRSQADKLAPGTYESSLRLHLSAFSGEVPAISQLLSATGTASLYAASIAARVEEASSAAARITKHLHSLKLPENLYLTPEPSLTAKLLGFGGSYLEEDKFLGAFGMASSLADTLATVSCVGAPSWDTLRMLEPSAFPQFESLAHCRNFLDATGLILPRVPRIIVLTKGQRRAKFKALVKTNAPTPYVRKAKTLVHQYERALRAVLDECMTLEYGPDWPQERLPLCDCRDLLKRPRDDGTHVLEYADYAHYRKITTHEEHFEAVFSAGFSDAVALGTLLDRIRKLRADSHHARSSFGQDELIELRTTWTTLESGLIALLPLIEYESGIYPN